MVRLHNIQVTRHCPSVALRAHQAPAVLPMLTLHLLQTTRDAELVKAKWLGLLCPEKVTLSLKNIGANTTQLLFSSCSTVALLPCVCGALRLAHKRIMMGHPARRHDSRNTLSLVW